MLIMAKTEKTHGPGYKVLLVEDHPMFREHLGQLINRDLGMSVCGEADNIRDAMQLIHERQPDIAIVDITLRGSSGLELLKDIKAQGLNEQVTLFLSAGTPIHIVYDMGDRGSLGFHLAPKMEE